VGTHRRRGLDRLLLGSVAEHLVRHAHCPVLVAPRTTQAARRAIAPSRPMHRARRPPPAQSRPTDRSISAPSA
jgi:hypothetical protein